MRYRIASLALAGALLASGAGLALDDKAAGATAVKPGASSAAARPGSADTVRKPAARPKLVDINSAKRAELKSLPGISDAQAGKIIAGRPYASKAHLVSRKIIDDATYEGVKKLIVAKQPYDDAAKNAALYAKKKAPSSPPAEGPK